MPLKIVSAALTAAAILIGTPQVAAAMDPKWPPGPYKYVVIEQELKDALIEFGRNINVPVKVSDEVKGKLRGDVGAGGAWGDRVDEWCAVRARPPGGARLGRADR